MQPFETWLKADLQAPVTVKRIDGNLFSGDNQGNLIGVTVTDAGEPATLSGEVRGYFIRSDGNTVIMSGTIDGNKVTVVLPSACYTFVGQFSLVIKVGQVAVGACTGYVYQSNTDSTVDPEHVIPDIDQLLTRVEALEGRATTLEGDVSAQNDTINAIEDGLAIIANGNVHPAIANGQFVYVKGHSSLAEGLYRATAAIGTNATLSTSNLTADGSGGLNALNADVASLNRKMTDVAASNAGAHNGIYRGKYLGSSVTSVQYAAISNGTFDDLYIGDYWTIGGHDWVICDFDYYYRTGSVDVTKHHVVLMPRGGMNIPAGTALYGASGTLTLLDGESATTKKWNATSAAPSTHTTAGGYKYSRMRTIIMKAANTIVVNAFGSAHVQPITELYPNPSDATASGLASNWDWFNVDDQSDAKSKSICDLCNETMVYGHQVWGKGSVYTNEGYEVGIDKWQLAIFALNRNFANIRAHWWLRSVHSATNAAYVDIYGNAGNTGSANALAVRPRFLLVG